MQNLGGAVIPMQISTTKIEYLVGNENILENMLKVAALPMFSHKMMSFLEDLSRTLLNQPGIKEYVDVMSYAYWIRKTSLEEAKKRHYDYENRMGRGVAFHIAPSNVPVNFAVSMTSALLAGNACVIRVSNKDFQQVTIICNAINFLLETTYQDLKPYFCIIRYEHDEKITQYITSMCDVRIIWGGDRTIRQVRQAQLPPRAVEMTFSDRHSIAIIDAETYMEEDAEKVAKAFFTDTYYTDQNACSSPRLVVWMGNHIQDAQERFWEALRRYVESEYTIAPIQAVDKYAAFCRLGMENLNVRLVSQDNYVVRVKVEKISQSLMEYKCGSGYFFEYEAKDLKEVLPVLDKKCQTVSVMGIDKRSVKDFVFENGVRGVDRIVPLGETMGLEFIWDGYKMIEAMTRYIYG